MVDISRETLEDLVRYVPGNICIYALREAALETLLFTPGVPSLHGLDDAAYRRMIEEDAFSVVEPDDLDYLTRVIAGCLAADVDVECVYRIFHRTRGSIWIRGKARHLGEFEGAPLLLCSFTDISLETEAQDRILNQSESEIYVCEAGTHNLLYANRRAADAAGKQPTARTGVSSGLTCYGFLQGRTEPCPWCGVPQMGDGTSHEEDYHLDGDDRYLHARTSRIDWYGREAFCVKVDDITERRRAQMEREEQLAQLEDSRRRLQSAIDGAHIAIWEYDIREHRIYSPEHSLSRWGLSDTIENLPWSMLPVVAEEDRESYLDLFARLEAGETSVSGDIRGCWGGPGTMFCDRFTYSAVKDADGTPLKAYCVVQDVTAPFLAAQRFERTIQQLLSANPDTLCSFQLNLTRNTCDAVFGSDHYTPQLTQVETVDELVERTAELIVGEADRERFLAELSREELLRGFAAGKTTAGLTYRRRMADGKPHWICTRDSMVQNPETLDVIAVVAVTDADDRMVEERIMQFITGADYDHISIIYPHEDKVRIFYHSPEAPMLLDEEQRKSLLDYAMASENAAEGWIHPDEVERFRRNCRLDNLLEQLRTADQYSFEVNALGTDDSGPRRKLITYTYLDDSHECILEAQRDITDIYREQQQRQAELAAQVVREQALKDEAMRANRMKSEFLSNVSHDMRTPLNAMLGYTFLALDDHDCPPRIRDYLDKVQGSGRLLLQLVNDTLDLNKIENGVLELRPETVDLGQMVEGLVQTMRPAATAKGLTLRVDVDDLSGIRVRTDPLRLDEILLNQLTNAVRFTPDDGAVTFRAERLAADDALLHVRFTVADTGCGMSEEFIPRVFEPFAQERLGGTGSLEGSGLGLAIVRRLVEMMGGSIAVQSVLGSGTTFTTCLEFSLATEADAPGAPQGPDPAGILEGTRMLLVEDNDLNTEVARTLLERQGITVVCAHDGREGVNAFRASAPGGFDAVLMDVRMPNMDGYAATRAIRAMERADARTVPIVAMTANAYDDDIARCLEAGMDAHLSKPIDPARLMGTLAEVVARPRADR